MFSTIISGSIQGIHSHLIQVEADVSTGLPVFNMVGLLSTEVRESCERVKVALRNSGLSLSPMHITINLSPANIRKSGTGLDLPIALAILCATGHLNEADLENTLVLGELSLTGEVKGVRGVLPIVSTAKKAGIQTCILPFSNAMEGAVVQGIRLIGVQTLTEAIAYCCAGQNEKNAVIPETVLDVKALFQKKEENPSLDFQEINGQSAAKRAVEIAAAGFHHLLMIGPPGSGKSMIAKRIPTILPPLSMEEALEVSSIYSVAGLLSKEQVLITKRPCLCPHHSTTKSALLGGGHVPSPGAISLAHRGVLFLDEIAEFPQTTLDLLRQPLEEHTVSLSRSTGTYLFPSDFMLVCAMNPCPCGYFPDRNLCRCSEREIHRYLSRISGPILDRIDLSIEVPRMDVSDLNNRRPCNETSAQIRSRVLAAREVAKKRFQNTSLRFNSDMEPQHIAQYCKLGSKEQTLLTEIYQKMNLSARSYHRLLKVARTIADLDESHKITEAHLAEASCYRIASGKYWNHGSVGG